MKKPLRIVLYYTIYLFLASCEQPTTKIEYVEVETEKEVEVEKIVTETIIEYEDRVETVVEYVDRTETIIEYVDIETETERIVEVEVEVERIVEKEVLVDNIINTETIVYCDKEIYIMKAEEIPAMEPIKEFDNYVTLNNKVLGVIDNGFEEIPLIKGLFKIGSVVYFTIDEKMYSQEKGVITEIEPADFPEIPASDFIEFADGIYKIQKSVNEDRDISLVYKYVSPTKEPRQGRYMIDGACMRGNDLIFSCPIDTGSLLKGLWIWTVNGNPLRLSESGRIW